MMYVNDIKSNYINTKYEKWNERINQKYKLL